MKVSPKPWDASSSSCRLTRAKWKKGGGGGKRLKGVLTSIAELLFFSSSS